MKKLSLIVAGAVCLLATPQFGGPPVPSGPAVWFELSSPQDGTSLSPGQSVEWTITGRVSPLDSFGLAFFSLDLCQDENNPERFDLPAGDAAPFPMVEFDRPAGFTNPATDPWGSGYGGTPTGREGERDLVQIGGAQNTFGRVGPCMGPDGDICMGQDPSLVLGVGQAPGGEVLASGHFSIPQAAGVYVFRLAGVRASCLVEANPPPFWSGVERARVWLDAPSISVVVP
ncbi:MAG: hypothetical protein VYE81_10960 [Planctomycetota bacterium]|nr:hypothetical protein [Planctomycetota bacterium]